MRYEDCLSKDSGLALREGGAHFENRSAVRTTLRPITARPDELGIAYVLAGGMALFLRGYRRFTEDVDILVSPAGLHRIHEPLEGRGYRPVFKGNRTWRDAETWPAAPARPGPQRPASPNPMEPWRRHP